MKYSVAEIEDRLRLGEDSEWEFKQIGFRGDKPKSPGRDALAEELVAFANADGGKLVCSVSDDGEAQKISYSQLKMLGNLFTELANDSIKPPLRIRTHHIGMADGAPLLIVEVPRGDALHETAAGAFIRDGNANRKMAGDERLRLAQQRAQARYLWFDKQPVPDTGFGTLEEPLWKPLLSAEGKANPEAALRRMALLAPDDQGVVRATVAGVLLCASAPEEHLGCAAITATLYRGEGRDSGQADAQVITGPLNRQITDAIDFAVRNMRVAARKTPARIDYPQYSERALFEALVNAVAHRDYAIRGSRIRLSMFADRLEISSPGALPNGLRIDDMAKDQSTRNDALVSALARMPARGAKGAGKRRSFMEGRGDGVSVIMRETEELSGRKPEYRLVGEAGLCLIIPASPQDTAALATIRVRSGEKPAGRVNLLLLFPDGKRKPAHTDSEGLARVKLYAYTLPMTVFAAAPGYMAYVRREWTPGEGALTIDLQPLRGGGSAIFPEGDGSLPGLAGSLQPIRDAGDRIYLNTSGGVSINRGSQAMGFSFGEELLLTDAKGASLLAQVVDIVGRAALVEYRRPPGKR